MVYTGPSRACVRCRQMKKSCNQQRPECSRCIDSGVKCEGYRDGFAVIYRDENEKAKTRSLVPKTRKDSRRPTPPRREESLTPRSIPTVAEDILIFFHSQFVLPAQQGGWPGPLSHLPEKYATAPRDACFKPALWAASYAILSRKRKDPHCQSQARVFYISALEAISQALKNNEYDDCTMMAIALLDLFQFIMDEEASTYGKHLNGLRAVLEKRRQKSAGDARRKFDSSDEKVNFVFDVFPQSQALLLNLKRRTPPSQKSIDWVAGLNKTYAATSVAAAYLQFAQISAQASHLCEIVRRKQEAHGFEEYVDFLELMSLVRIADVIDRHNEGWWQIGHPKWSVTRKNSSELAEIPSGCDYIDCYSSVWASCVWNTYRAARVILCDTMLDCTDVLKQSTYCNSIHLAEVQTSADKSKQIIRDMTEDVRASLPFVLGQVDSSGCFQESGAPTALSGQSILWPLSVLQDCEYSDQAWASRLLGEIGQRTGIQRMCALARKNAEGG